MRFYYKLLFSRDDEIQLELIASTWDEVLSRITDHRARFDSVDVVRVEAFRVHTERF